MQIMFQLNITKYTVDLKLVNSLHNKYTKLDRTYFDLCLVQSNLQNTIWAQLGSWNKKNDCV